MSSVYIENVNKPIGSTFIDSDIEEAFNGNNSIFKYQQDQSKSINQRAFDFFIEVIGHDSVKRQLYRALLKEDKEQLNILLGGASGTSKTLFMQIIEKKCNGVIYYDAAAGSTGAGLIELLRNNLNVRIIIIDEIAELRTNDLKTFRGLLNNGRVSKALKTIITNFTIKNPKILCTTNNLKKINADLPLKNRFQTYLIKKYSDEQFIKVLFFCLTSKGIIKNHDLAMKLCRTMLKLDIKHMRIAESICKLIHEDKDSDEDIMLIIKDYVDNNGSNCNIDFNTEDS